MGEVDGDGFAEGGITWTCWGLLGDVMVAWGRGGVDVLVFVKGSQDVDVCADAMLRIAATRERT